MAGNKKITDLISKHNQAVCHSRPWMPQLNVVNVAQNQSRVSAREDRDGATEVTSPESNVCLKQFDICRIKNPTTIVLKKSLFEINRARRKEMESMKDVPSFQYLNPGMILIKNYISKNDQVKVAEKCRALGLGPGGFYRPGYKDGSKLQLHMMCLGMNWDPECLYTRIRQFDGTVPPEIPKDFSSLVAGVMRDSHVFLKTYNKKSYELPDMSPDICIVNFYSNQGKLGLHQDKDESSESIDNGLPVVSFSLGDSAEFRYGKTRDIDNTEKVLLESGDVLIFGGKSRLIYHGVTSILPNSAPKWFTEQTNMLPGRLNLTFRKY